MFAPASMSRQSTGRLLRHTATWMAATLLGRGCASRSAPPRMAMSSFATSPVGASYSSGLRLWSQPARATAPGGAKAGEAHPSRRR
eukprot:scaffold3111_cov332-Prasinococcus_capsulatus_cf.AAC.10